MLKNLKKLFSVAEEDLEIDEKEITDEHYEAFRNELKQFNLDKTTSDFNELNNINDTALRGIKGLDVEDIRVKEIDSDEANRAVEVVSGRKNFDFEKEIDKAYDEDPVNKRVINFVGKASSRKEHQSTINKNDINNKRVYDVKDLLIKPDDYVLRDIISPMKGVVRKEAHPIVNKPIENPQKKSKIIKMKELRNQVDVSEIDTTSKENKKPKEEKSLPPLESIESPRLQTKSSVNETSRFTIVEDSTGEMRLFIDENEE